jgi:hypothetical protein
METKNISDKNQSTRHCKVKVEDRAVFLMKKTKSSALIPTVEDEEGGKGFKLGAVIETYNLPIYDIFVISLFTLLNRLFPQRGLTFRLQGAVGQRVRIDCPKFCSQSTQQEEFDNSIVQERIYSLDNLQK